MFRFKIIKRHYVLSGIFFFCFHSFFAQKNTGDLIVKIHPVFNQSPLVLSEKLYVNENGDSVFIDVLKFYMSNICLLNEKQKTFNEVESYHLIDAEDSATLYFRIKNIPEGSYHNFIFSIGVDSIKNVSGALAGDLDPIKGMYWAWNTGYIAAKLEGRSKVCKTLRNAFEFHVGGYLPPYNSLRKNAVKISGLKIISDKTSCLELYADVSEWFKLPVKIDVSKINSIVLPNKQSVLMADNYSDMIRFKSNTNP